MKNTYQELADYFESSGPNWPMHPDPLPLDLAYAARRLIASYCGFGLEAWHHELRTAIQKVSHEVELLGIAFPIFMPLLNAYIEPDYVKWC